MSNRFYYDSYLHRYTEAQLENSQLRREILNLKEQVQTLKWYSGDLKNENNREKLKTAEQGRFYNTKVNDLEHTVSDLRHDNYLVKKEAGLKAKQLNEEKQLAQSRAERLEWLNAELRREKDRHARLASEYEYQSLRKASEASQIRSELSQERRRTEVLDRLNSSLERSNANLSFELSAKRVELKESGDRIERLTGDRDRLLTDVSYTRERLNETRDKLNETKSLLNRSELNNSVLSTSLKKEQKEKESLRQNSFELTRENLDCTRKNQEYKQKLLNHERMFREVYEESRNHLEKLVVLAQRNHDISVDDLSPLSDNESGLDLNKSDAFTNFHEKQQNPSQDVKKSIHDDISRDLRMYRLESNLNDSLERLKKTFGSV